MSEKVEGQKRPSVTVAVEKPPMQGFEPGLRRVPDRIPWVVLLIIVVELGERFTYFGLSGPLQNYIKYVWLSRGFCGLMVTY